MRYTKWMMVIVLVLVTIILVSNIDTKTECYNQCADQGYIDGMCVSMQQGQSCEDKFEMQSISKEHCSQKQPGGYYRSCCCN
tara:strand:+ start:986 stop:1231 length:246 start_codon:yes stop_codon:yes gene_type:complete